MKSLYKISTSFSLNLDDGCILDQNGKMIGITAYQERFLKYLIQNPNKPCILSNIKDFVYRGETIPNETPDFYTQLIHVCPDLRQRISVQKYALMDIGYQYKLPTDEEWAKLYSESDYKNAGEFTSLVQDLQNSLTPQQRTVLKILLYHHNKPLTYQTIIKLSHTKLAEGERPLQNTFEIIKACNAIIEKIPELSEVLLPVPVHTVAYMYQPLPQDDIAENETASLLNSKQSDSYIGSHTNTAYPPQIDLDTDYIYVGDNTYINLNQGMAITYMETEHTVTEIKLAASMILFLQTLVTNQRQVVEKEVICENVFPDYYTGDMLNDGKRLQDLKSRLVTKVTALSGCINSYPKKGYSIQFPQRPQ